MNLIEHYHHATQKALVWTGFGDGSMHAFVGMCVYALAMLLFPPRRGSINTILLVVAAACFDAIMERAFWGSWRWHDMILNFIMTLFWPTVHFTMGRYRHARWNRWMQARQAAHRMLIASIRPHRLPAAGAAQSAKVIPMKPLVLNLHRQAQR